MHATSDREPERLDLRLKYEEVAESERVYAQLRFQTISLFLAAVGLIIGLSPHSRGIGALLLVIGFGLWVLDLRTRDMVWTFRQMGIELEQRMNELNAGSGGLFVAGRRHGQRRRTRLGFFNSQFELESRAAGLVSYQVGIDIIVFGVMGYGVHLLIARGGWWWLDAFIPVGLAWIVFLILRATSSASPSLA